MTYYQPIKYEDDGTNVNWWDIPDELFSFQAFESAIECKLWLKNMGYDPDDYVVFEYHDEDIEDVTIIDEYGELIYE